VRGLNRTRFGLIAIRFSRIGDRGAPHRSLAPGPYGREFLWYNALLARTGMHRNYLKGSTKMARCANCGKTTSFGHNRSFSQRATNRDWKPNLQKVTYLKNGRLLKEVMCTKCIKAMGKSKV
jgi:large subunit ribosomal protein L28